MSGAWLADMKKARKRLRDAADRAAKAWFSNPTSAATRAAMDRLEEAVAAVDKFPQ